MSGREEHLAVTIARLEQELRTEFPDWYIKFGRDSGNWVAIRKGVGSVVTSNAVQLQEKLRMWTDGTASGKTNTAEVAQGKEESK